MVFHMSGNGFFLSFQCEVFKNDFELERHARQEIAGEREKLCAEINLLKKRNQLLVEEAQ